MFVSFFVRKSIITHWFVVVVCCFVSASASFSVGASENTAKAVAVDEVEELIEEGKRSYKKGDLTDAQESLQNALNLIAELSVKSYMGLLPKAPKGWVVEETSADESALFSGIGGLVVATKRYKKEDSVKTPSASVVSTIAPTIAPTMQVALVSNLPAFAQMAVNAMAQLQGVKTGAEIIVVAGHKGSISCDKKSKCEVMIQLGESAIVTAESKGIEKQEFLALIEQLKLDNFPVRQ